jgi:hypothetical protein
VASGGHNRKTARELAQAATVREERLLKGSNPGREHLTYLLDAWARVARTAVAEIEAETTVTIVNAGDQVQKHPGVTVLEAASKRIEALVVMVDRFDDTTNGAGGELVSIAPPRVWNPDAEA